MTHKFLVMFAALFLVGFISPCARAQEKKLELGETPFSIDSDKIVIQVRFAGTGPYRMVLRTGIPSSHVDASFAGIVKKSGGMFLPLSPIPVDVKEVKTKVLAQLKDVEVGSFRIKSLLAVLEDFYGMNATEQRLSAPVHGLLGFNLLNSRVAQIDYPRRVIRFLASSPYKKDDVRQGDARRFTIALRMSPVDWVPVIDDVYIQGKRVKAVLDTGFTGALALTPRGIKSLGLPTTGVQPAVVVMKVGKAPEISLTPELVPEGAYTYQRFEAYDAVIGYAFLSNYILTFDRKGKLVTLERP